MILLLICLAVFVLLPLAVLAAAVALFALCVAALAVCFAAAVRLLLAAAGIRIERPR